MKSLTSGEKKEDGRRGKDWVRWGIAAGGDVADYDAWSFFCGARTEGLAVEVVMLSSRVFGSMRETYSRRDVDEWIEGCEQACCLRIRSESLGERIGMCEG